MLKLKDSSVSPNGLQPEMYYALGVASTMKKQMFGLDCVITSLTDGHHNPNSLHPAGRAADFRTMDMTSTDREKWFNALKQELGPIGYDVVWEGAAGATPATSGAHVHIEWDPHGKTFW